MLLFILVDEVSIVDAGSDSGSNHLSSQIKSLDICLRSIHASEGFQGSLYLSDTNFESAFLFKS